MALTIEEVETAIQEVLINQSYEIHGRKYTRADLNSLRELLIFLEDREDQDKGEGVTRLKKGAYSASFH